MASIDALKQLYTDYFTEYMSVLEKAAPTDGLLGIGRSPKDDPCHETFYNNVETWVGEFLAAAPSSEEINEAAAWILKAADAHREDDAVFWILFAAHGHAAPLIPLMKAEDRKELLAWYDRHHPRFTRLPVQKHIGKLLKK